MQPVQPSQQRRQAGLRWLGAAPERTRAVWRTLRFGRQTLAAWVQAEGDRRRLSESECARRLAEAVQRWGRQSLDAFGVQLSVAGTPVSAPVCGHGGRLVVANHRSPLDIPVLLSLFGGTVVSRHDLAHWPVIGWAARTAGVLFVDRASATSGAAVIRHMGERLAAGATVAIFPEGQTHSGDAVRPFRRGAFIASRRAPCEIVPVGLAYPRGCAFVDESFVAHLWRVAGRAQTRVVAAVGAAYRPVGNAAARAREAEARVAGLVAQARALADAEASEGVAEPVAQPASPTPVAPGATRQSERSQASGQEPETMP